MVGASFTVAAVAQVLRQKRGIIAQGNAQVSTTQSKFGGASAYFDGSGDSIEVGNNSDALILSGDFTIEMWFRVGNQNAYLFTNEKGTVGANKLAVYILPTVGRLDWYLGGTPALNTNASSVVINTWTHIAFVRSSNIVSCYINGVQQTSTKEYSPDLGNVSTSTDTWYFGGRGSVDPMLGHLDEIRISKSARYTTTFTPSTTPFVNDANTLLLIHANGTNASTFFEDDNGVRASNGITAVGSAQVSTTQSKFGGTSLFPNTGYLSVPDSDDFAISTNYTIECWVYATTVDANYRNFWSINDGGANYYSFYYQTTAGWGVEYATSGGVLGGSRTGSSPLNTWRHFAFVKNGTNGYIFVDGVQLGATLTSLTNGSNLTSAPRIGQFSSSSNGWAGYIDEFRISNSARYTANFTPSTTPFVNDSNTLLLIHADGTNASTVFRDDNGQSRSPKGISAIGNAQIDTAQSKFGGSSLLLDGTGDYLTVENIADGITQDQTFEFWIRFADLPGSGDFRMIAGGNDAVRYVGVFNNGGTYVWEVSFSSGQYVERFTTSLSTGVWYHVALTKSAATLKMYQAGTALTSSFTYSTMTANHTLFTSGTNIIGSWNTSSYFFNGHLDEIRVSNSVRYTAAFTPSTIPFQNDANTVLLIHADGTDASTVFTDDNGIAPYTP
jgi:hypothetical protein